MTRSIPAPRIIIPILAACTAACVISLCLFRDLPQTSAWKGWRILTCPVSMPESAVTDALEAFGIDDYASYTNSRLKSPAGQALPEPLLAETNARRSAWFVHEKTRFFYLRDRNDLDRKLGQALAELGSGWYLEGEEGFIPLLVILSLAGWAVMFFFSRNKAIGLSALLPAAILPYSLNRWPGLAAAIAISLSSYLAAEYVPFSRLRESPGKTLTRILKAPYLAGSLFLLIPLFFFVSPGSMLRIAFSALIPPVVYTLGSEGLECLNRKTEAKRAHPRFTPVRMVNRKSEPRPATALKALGLAVLFAAAGFAAQTAPIRQGGISSGELSLPVPARYTGQSGFGAEAFDDFMGLRDETGLPDLGDFLIFRWSVDTFPWRKLQESRVVPERGSAASYMEYRIGPDGKIAGTPKTMLTFDSAFIRHALSADSTPLERMLQDQGRFVSAKMTRISR